MDDGGTRSRMVDAALTLFQREGYRATSWRRLTATAGTPWGSIHHHFPGGKEELALAAVARGSELVGHLLDATLADTTQPAAAVRQVFRTSARLLRAGDYSGGCPLAALALDTASSSEPLREACARAFIDWERRMAAFLEAAGWSRADARSSAAAALAAWEGALLLSRVRRTTRPLDAAGVAVETWLACGPGPAGRRSAPVGH